MIIAKRKKNWALRSGTFHIDNLIPLGTDNNSNENKEITEIFCNLKRKFQIMYFYLRKNENDPHCAKRAERQISC